MERTGLNSGGETLKDDSTVSHTPTCATLRQCSHMLPACDNTTAQHLMDDISKQIHEDTDAHTTLHGLRGALERMGAMTWRVETLTTVFDPRTAPSPLRAMAGSMS